MACSVGGRLVGVGLLLGAACLVGLIWAMPSPEPEPYASTFHVTPPSSPTVALWVGDSYSGGAAGIPGRETFPWRACARLKWVCNVDGQGGTGYVSEGPPRDSAFAPYLGRLAADKSKYLADYVIVTGGRNDIGKPGVTAAATSYYRSVKLTYPDAVLVVVEPFWATGSSNDGIRSLRSEVRAAAKNCGAIWVPSGDWLDRKLLAADGVHPTAAGHEQLAARVSEALLKISVAPAP